MPAPDPYCGIGMNHSCLTKARGKLVMVLALAIMCP